MILRFAFFFGQIWCYGIGGTPRILGGEKIGGVVRTEGGVVWGILTGNRKVKFDDPGHISK